MHFSNNKILLHSVILAQNIEKILRLDKSS